MSVTTKSMHFCCNNKLIIIIIAKKKLRLKWHVTLSYQRRYRDTLRK